MQPTNASSEATPTATPATDNASATPNGNAAEALLTKAQQWLKDSNAKELLNKVPASLKNVGNTATTGFNKLSTTQKVVGGALLVAGATYLARRGSSAKRAQAATINELLYFVNDRIEGYRRAADESQDTQHRSYYLQLVSQSQQFANQLNAYLDQEGAGRQNSTTLKGKLYRAFMDAKAAVTGRDESSIIGSNIYGEEWALKAYEEALNDGTLTGPMRRAVEHQYAQSKKTYGELKRMDATTR
ncbi:PA2169 family four-helix-bundle protein [Hymenobacter sp. BT523]|uniref:PA2169 family four-helix-bundle protein n=1 Tax=Hymenobacter sp. BT523 TaxID=2795725 RepID=UPI0018ED06D4|nr:PA2169 family four-helix-bundle protein [Hymenobacter sp. BT523]MBJ6110574.1 PA2169 family four-helix-bundle protein [Hymenobacter sp. BT523]